MLICSEGDKELLFTRGTGQFPASWTWSDTQPALTTWTSEFNLDGLCGDVNLVVTRTATDARRALFDTGNEYLGTRRAGEFLLSPLTTSGCMIDADLRAAQSTINLSEANWQHPITVRAVEYRRCNTRLHLKRAFITAHRYTSDLLMTSYVAAQSIAGQMG